MKERRSYRLIPEIVHREHGISCDGQRSLRNGNSNGFEKRFHGSRLVVEKLKLLHSINIGNGVCQEKALSFNRVGNLLCCTSPAPIDNKVQVWNWGVNNLKFSYESSQKRDRICDLKFIEINESLNIVSVNDDGDLVLATVPQGASQIRTKILHQPNCSSCKLALCPQNPFVILSASMNGLITNYDIRVSPAAVSITVVHQRSTYFIQLYSISHHPFDPELCTSCDDNYVRVYDQRNMSQTVHEMCPQDLIDRNRNLTRSSVYSSTGSEILGSYSYEDNYLFNNKVYIPGSCLHHYSGHYPKNVDTIVGYSGKATFFGPNSEYVISSSKFGGICIWDKNTEEIIDIIGGNVYEELLQPHPSIPILASFGNRGKIRIWSPMNE